jgi:hypothetical protein
MPTSMRTTAAQPQAACISCTVRLAVVACYEGKRGPTVSTDGITHDMFPVFVAVWSYSAPERIMEYPRT